MGDDMIKLQRKQEPIKIIEVWNQDTEHYAQGALVEIASGTGALREVYGECDNVTFITLMLGNQSLFQLQGDEYFCPTCDKIIKSGYGLTHTPEFMKTNLNEMDSTLSMSDMVQGISPILGLLKKGYYVILDTKLYPTDGNGHLFCCVPNAEEYAVGSCPYYYGGNRWGHCRPHFTVGTEPNGIIEESRVEYYQKHNIGRALAYHMDGYMTALLDGHHKALAAARNQDMLNALVIMPCHLEMYRHYEDAGVVWKIQASDELIWNCEEYGLRPELIEPTEQLDKSESAIVKYSFVSEYVDEKMNMLANGYPSADVVAAMDLAGGITEERIEKILQGKEIISEDDVVYMIQAMVVKQDDNILRVFDYLFRNAEYARQRYPMLKAFLEVPKTEGMVSYLIELMVEYEEDYPDFKDLILDYI